MTRRTLGLTFNLRMTSGSNGRTMSPSGPMISRTVGGWYSVPPLAGAASAVLRGTGVRALADAGLVGLAREDLGTERILLPGVSRDDPGDLARQIDTGRRPEPILLGPISETIDPEHACELVEERVAGVSEPAIDVAG